MPRRPGKTGKASFGAKSVGFGLSVPKGLSGVLQTGLYLSAAYNNLMFGVHASNRPP